MTKLKLLEFSGLQVEDAWDTNNVKRSAAKLKEAAQWLRKLKLPKSCSFEFDTFGNHEGKHSPKEKNYCGTSACALGWMGIKKVFGLTGEWSGNNGKEWDVDQGKWVPVESTDRAFTVRHKSTDETDFMAGAAAFGITEYASEWLFLPDSYDDGDSVTKEQVADRMEFLAEHGVCFN